MITGAIETKSLGTVTLNSNLGYALDVNLSSPNADKLDVASE